MGPHCRAWSRGRMVLSLTAFQILFVQNESHLITFPFVLKLFSVKDLNLEKYKNKGQQDSSSKKGVVAIPDASGSSPRNLYGRRREPASTSSPLTSTSASWHVHVCTQNK